MKPTSTYVEVAPNIWDLLENFCHFYLVLSIYIKSPVEGYFRTSKIGG